MQEELSSYLQEVAEETELKLNDFNTYPLAFTSYVLDLVSTISNIGDCATVHSSIKSADGRILGEIYGYSFSENLEMLTLYYTIYDQGDAVKDVQSTEFQTAMNRLQGFYGTAIRAGYLDYNEDNSTYEILKAIYDNQSTINTVKLCLLSNCSIKDYVIKNNRIAGKTTLQEVWDIKKLHAMFHSGLDHLAIDIDFEDGAYKAYKIPYIQMESKEYQYKCIMAMFPAMLLYRLYEKHNTDLLLSNVRYFLGFKGSKKKNANIGIQNTLLNENQMFLAYNNGVTALAASIDATGEQTMKGIESEDDATKDSENHFDNFISTGVLRCIHDFRIVNGGQTTASIFFSKKDKGAHLRGVFVPIKIILLSSDMETVAGNITKYSNSQSPIKYADFSVSNEFNVGLENLSRSILAPTPDHTPQYWFYERVRGQYDQERNKCKRKEDTAYFSMLHPKEKKFSKELLAKVWTSWLQKPDDAVKGSGTTYDVFMNKILSDKYVPDESYYKNSIALIILYKFLESRPENRQYGNKKAAVIAYTLALLEYFTHGRYDLIKVWDAQEVPPASVAYLNQLAEDVKDALTNLAGETGVLSYSKRKQTFKELCDYGIDIRIDDIRIDMD